MTSIHGVDAEVRRLNSIGLNHSKIALTLRIPPSTVSRVLGPARKAKDKPKRSGMWTDENTAKLHRLWMDGHSGSIIAYMLGTTRSAVLAKVMREGLPKRTDHGVLERKLQKRPVQPKGLRVPAGAPKRNARPPREKLRSPVICKKDANHPITNNTPSDVASVASVEALERHHCRWPVGDPMGDFKGFCGDDAVEGKSYCKHHAIRSAATPRQLATIQRHEEDPTLRERWLQGVKAKMAGRAMDRAFEDAEELQQA